MLDERRESSDRDICAIAASISIGKEGAEIPCVVENLSERGAKLRFESETIVPPRVNLLIPVFEGQTHDRLAEVRWRMGAAIGVRFLD